MAKDSSFDVVSQIDMQEIDNAYGQAKKEISQRYDLKDSGADISSIRAERPSPFPLRATSCASRSSMS